MSFVTPADGTYTLTAADLGDSDHGIIAEVFEAGFVRGDRLVRPARVVVFQE